MVNRCGTAPHSHGLKGQCATFLLAVRLGLRFQVHSGADDKLAEPREVVNPLAAKPDRLVAEIAKHTHSVSPCW